MILTGNFRAPIQSYFLCQLNQKQLAKAIFPIGHLTKSQVRDIAKKSNLITANKKDSQGLCFIGKVKLPDFLKQRLTPKKGKVIKIDVDKNQKLSEALRVRVLPTFMIYKFSEMVWRQSGVQDANTLISLLQDHINV